MKFRRLTLIGIVILASTYLAENTSHALSASAPTSAPLYQFVDTGTQPLPWNALALSSKLNGTTMLGGPHGATNATEGVIAYRTSGDDLALFTQGASGTSTWTDLSTASGAPAPEADPVPFFDPSGNVDLLYVDQSGDVVVLSPNETSSALWSHYRFSSPWTPYIATNLSALTGVPAASGTPSVDVEGTNATIAYLSAAKSIEVLTISWSNNQPVPIYSQNSFDETSATLAPGSSVAPTSTTSTSTTSATASFTNEPVVLPSVAPAFVTDLSNGAVVEYDDQESTLAALSAIDLSAETGAPAVSGAMSLGSNTSAVDIAGLDSNGDVELFSSAYDPSLVAPAIWGVSDISSLATSAPPLDGTLSVEVTPSQVAVAGQAANWGDLFVLTSPSGSGTWSATDVSVTAGSNARSIGTIVAGLQINGQLTLYAAGVSSPPPQGVGVYAIPSAKWSTAITSGWPIISETGGLGTQAAPWVGFTSATSVATSPDFLLGQAIYNSHKRVTWLSFWTVSGPLAGQAKTTTSYYNHGYAAGVWVATQIDTYRSLGVGLKPDWVILDPEGYPDDHSALDAPGGSSKATLATYATYWSSMLQGWQAGIHSVDPSLNAAVYASQSEYADYALSSVSMPVFEALAFSAGGPTPIAGASGSNIRGYIAFGAACTPASKLASEASTLLNPPWAGQFNTLQFNSGVYCAPPST